MLTSRALRTPRESAARAPAPAITASWLCDTPRSARIRARALRARVSHADTFFGRCRRDWRNDLNTRPEVLENERRVRWWR